MTDIRALGLSIYDYEIWEHCPFRLLVPSHLEIRYKYDGTCDWYTVIIWDEKAQRHVDVALREEDLHLSPKDMQDRFLNPMLETLRS